MLNIFKAISLFTLFILITSCSVDLSDYQKTNPKFDIQRYFTGELIAWGMVQDYSNQVTRRFCVELNEHGKKTKENSPKYFISMMVK